MLSDRKLEQYCPQAIAFLVTTVCFMMKVTVFDIKRFDSILDAFISMNSIIIGFLATMISVLIATVRKSIMRKIRKSNATKLLTSYINISVVSGLAATIYSVIFNAFIGETSCIFWYLFLIWIFGTVFFLASTHRIITILLRVLNEMAMEDDDDRNDNNLRSDSKNYRLKI